jgi:hypothetical protein
MSLDEPAPESKTLSEAASKTESASKTEVPQWLTNVSSFGPVLAALPVVGLVSAWLFQFGYAIHFGIPVGLITLDTLTVAIAITWCVGVLAAYEILVWLSTLGNMVRASLTLGLPAVPFAWLCLHGDREVGDYDIVLCVLLFVVVSLWVLPRHRDKLARLWAKVAKRWRWAQPGLFFALFFSLSLSMGIAVASMKFSYPVRNVDGKDLVVLAIYGQTMVSAPLKKPEKKVSQEFYVTKIDEGVTPMKIERVGPLDKVASP